ncbi:hypothetical protein HanPSC8_Chr15g0691061 [Helianthus annuus]|nr:hypothetical protein HanPSC8_Chr15g0691061 [Helianthus annuus]
MARSLVVLFSFNFASFSSDKMIAGGNGTEHKVKLAVDLSEDVTVVPESGFRLRIDETSFMMLSFNPSITPFADSSSLSTSSVSCSFMISSFSSSTACFSTVSMSISPRSCCLTQILLD